MKKIYILLLFLISLYSYANKSYIDKGFLWQINTNTDQQIYLFATMHYGKPDLYPLNTKTLNALKNSDILALELNEEDLQKLDKTTYLKEIWLKDKNFQNFQDFLKLSFNQLDPKTFNLIIKYLTQ